MARLHRVFPGSDPGLGRSLSSHGALRLTRADGRAASARDRRRIESLVIPPAWTDVWICADPLGHIQAVGTDAAERRQYLYHPQWQARVDGSVVTLSFRGKNRIEHQLELEDEYQGP